MRERFDCQRNPFAVTDDLKISGNRRADEVADILHVKRTKKPGAFGRAERSEIIAEVLDGPKPGGLRQILSGTDPGGQRAVLSPQKIRYGVHGRRVTLPHPVNQLDIFVLAAGVTIEKPLQESFREDRTDQFDRQVELIDRETFPFQVSFQVSRCRIGTVDLGKRRRNQ